VSDAQAAKDAIAMVRYGGLTQERCQVVLLVPPPQGDPEDEGEEDDDDFDWSAAFKALLETPVHAASPSPFLADGNVLMERPVVIPEKEEGGPEDAQMLLDFASHAADELEHMDLVSSWSLRMPKGVKFKSKDGPTEEFFREFSQRLLGAVFSVESGWFFDAWSQPTEVNNGEDESVLTLQACLERGHLDLRAQEQVMVPTGGKHTHTFIYLHGFTCDGYGYMCEPEHFYRAKKAKKKGAKGKKAKAKDKEEEMEMDFEPIPGLKCVFPSAPRRTISAGPWEAEAAWYNYLDDKDGEAEDSYPPEELEEMTKWIHEIIAREAALVGGQNVFLGGASQGSGVAAHAALTYNDPLGALCLTMGHLLEATPVTPEWAERKVPVHVFHGLKDDTIPWEKMAAPSYERLSSEGADVRITTEEGVDHGEGELVWVQKFLADAMTKGKPVKKAPAKGKKK